MAVTGLISTYQAITNENRVVRVVDEDMMALEPEVTALTQVLMHTKKKSVIRTPKIEWLNDDYVEQWVAASAAVAGNSASVTISMTDGSAVVVGDLLLAISSTSANHEQMLVTAKPSANVATVTRNIGSTGLLAIASGAGIMIIGQAHEEGSGAPVAKTSTITTVVNYIETFKKAVYITGTAAATKQYASNGDERARKITKAAKEFKIHMNNQFLFGKPYESLTGGANGLPIRTTGGIDHYVQTNRQDVGGVLTWKQMMTFSRMAFRYHAKAFLFASPLIMSAITEFAKGHSEIGQSEEKFGLTIRRLQMGNGEWMLVRDHSLRDGIAGTPGFGGYAYSLNMDAIKRRYLDGRDTRIIRDRQGKDIDAFLDTIEGDHGLEVQQEKWHARLYGVTDYSA